MKIFGINPSSLAKPSTTFGYPPTATPQLDMRTTDPILAHQGFITKFLKTLRDFGIQSTLGLRPHLAFADVTGIRRFNASPADMTFMCAANEPAKGTAAAAKLSEQPYTRTTRDRLLPEEVVFPYLGPESRKLAAELRALIKYQNPHARYSALQDFFAALARESKTSDPTHRTSALEIGFGYAEENIDALLKLGVAITATELDGHKVRRLKMHHLWSCMKKRLNAYTTTKFDTTVEKMSPHYDIVILNLPHPHEQVAHTVLGVVDRVVEPGTFVVVSTDVAFIYFPHFWSNKEEWKTILLEKNTPFPLMKSANNNSNGRIGIFRKR